MSSTVTKAGPYYATGSISFSSLRSNFRAQVRKDTSSSSETFNSDTAPIKASELLRVTSTSNTNPIVPDCTENRTSGPLSNGISTGSNWKVSQFRNSIKYYYITQSGTDLNYDIDAAGWNTNLNKNILKFMFIDGTCGSNTNATYAAIHSAETYNLTVDVFGTIWGGKGPKGTKASPNAGNGGGALYTESTGGTILVNIRPSALVYGGGGGGAGGQDGTAGAGGACYTRTTYVVSGYCGGCSGCGGGYTINCSGSNYSSYGARRIGGCGAQSGCACWFGWYRGWNCTRTKYTNPTCERYDPYCVSGAPGGVGSDGFDGRGYDNQEPNPLGSATATAGTEGGCPSYGGSGTDGIAGGDGGDWGKDGVGTARAGVTIGNGGTRGRAIGPAGGNYSVTGSINTNTVKGLYNP